MAVTKKIEQKIEAVARKRKVIKLARWKVTVKKARQVQCPIEYRIIFDIESDPRYDLLSVTDKVTESNRITEIKIGSKEFKRATRASYELAVAYINDHAGLKLASNVLYANLLAMYEFRTDLREVFAKARVNPDPDKMLKVWNWITKNNKDYAEAHEPQAKDKAPPKDVSSNMVLPEYWNKGKSKVIDIKETKKDE